MNAPEPLIGKRVTRKEDYRFLTGAGQYTDDLKREGMWRAVVLRSRDGGRTWEDANAGLPNTGRANIEAFNATAWTGGYALFVGHTDGEDDHAAVVVAVGRGEREPVSLCALDKARRSPCALDCYGRCGGEPHGQRLVGGGEWPAITFGGVEASDHPGRCDEWDAKKGMHRWMTDRHPRPARIDVDVVDAQRTPFNQHRAEDSVSNWWRRPQKLLFIISEPVGVEALQGAVVTQDAESAVPRSH